MSATRGRFEILLNESRSVAQLILHTARSICTLENQREVFGISERVEIRAQRYYNGRLGAVKSFHAGTDKYLVELRDSGEQIQVSRQNLTSASLDQEALHRLQCSMDMRATRPKTADLIVKAHRQPISLRFAAIDEKTEP